MEPRERLLAARAEVLAQVRSLDASFADIVEAARDSNLDDEHDPEGSTIAVERSLVSSLSAISRRRLAEIDAALARVDDGTYGICLRCRGPVGEGRLEARLAAALCIECAS